MITCLVGGKNCVTVANDTFHDGHREKVEEGCVSALYCHCQIQSRFTIVDEVT